MNNQRKRELKEAYRTSRPPMGVLSFRICNRWSIYSRNSSRYRVIACNVIPAIQTRSIQRSESIFKEICSGIVEMVYNRGAGCVNIRLLAYQISYKKDMI